MLVFLGYTIIIMSIPLTISYYLYYYKPKMANSSRPQKTIILSILSFFALDLAGVILANFAHLYWFSYCGVFITFQKVFMVGSTIPFYFLSTKYWDPEDIEHDNRTSFFGIQIFGLLIGVVIGFITAMNGYDTGKLGLFSLFFMPGL